MSATAAAPTATRPPPRQRPSTGGSSGGDDVGGDSSPSSVTQSLSSFFAGVTAKPVSQPSPRNNPPQAQPRPNNALPVNANGPVRAAPPNGMNGSNPMQPRPANGAAPNPQQRMQRPASGGPQSFPPANGTPRPAGAPIAGAAPRPQPGASPLNPALPQNNANRPPPQQRLSGGPGAFPRAAPPTVPSPQPSESPADASSSLSSGNNSSDDWKTQFDRLLAESRQYKRVTQEELETMKRNRISLQNQLQESQANAAEANRQLAEQSSRVSELTAALTKSRAAAETELNFFNLEVEKEIARSKQDKEKARLQATLASYEDAHKKNKKIIETLNGEIVKLKQAYKAIANGNGAISTTNGTSSTSTTSSASSSDVAQVVELQNKLTALETSSAAELAEAKRQLEASNTQLSELKAGLAKNASASDASAESSLLLQAQVTELKSSNTGLESRVKQLNEELERRLTLHESQLKEKWVQIAALQSELEKLKAAQEESLSKQQAAAKSREEALQKRVNEAESTVVAFRERNDALSKDKQALTIQLDESQTLVASLRQDLLTQSERFNKDEKALRGTLAERSKQLEALRIEKDDAVKELTHQLSELANKMEGNTLQHREKVAQMDAAFNALKASTAAEIANLQAELQKVREDAAAAEKEATSKLEAAQSQIEAVERRSVDLQLQLKEKKAALNAYHEQIEYNARQREERLRNTPAKKPSLLDSIAKKLSIGDKEKQDDVLAVDMFNEAANLPASASSSSGFSSSRGPAGSAMSEQARNELAEEVAVSLSKRLQESENAKLALENELRALRRQPARPPQANSTPGRPMQATPGRPVQARR